MAEFKPTNKEAISPQSKSFEKNFSRTMTQNNVHLTEEMLNEKEQSLKKKIFSLAKMEALVFSDPKLSAVYNEMSENGEEKYGYHYNETIQNMIFNDYVLNSPKYLQKYKMAIPKEKKRRDKSGINQLKNAGEKHMQTRNVEPKPTKVNEGGEEVTKVQFLVNETDPENQDVFAYFPEEPYNEKYNSGYSHVGQHTGVHPEYAAESRPATPEEYAPLKAELEGQGYNLEVLNDMNEMTGTGGGAGAAFSGSGQYTAPLGYGKKVDETTDSSSSGAYAGPAAWGGGDLMKGSTSKKPIMPGAKAIQESNYLTESDGFEKYINMLNEQSEEDFIKDNSDAYSLDGMGKDNEDIIVKDIKTGKLDTPNIKEETQTMIQPNGTSMSNKMQPTGDQPGGLNMGMQAGGGMNENKSIDESFSLLEEINNELNAFSIHHDKLKRMAEDRKPSALVLKDRLGDENKVNFKKDLQHSGTKEVIDVEKELQWKDQQTEIGKDPYKLGQDIENKALKVGDMKSGEALKNVGDSANDEGDEIPKRNLTKEEQDEVNLYRKGLGDYVYDNEVGKKFEDRMKADMGDNLYKQRQDKLAFNAKAPMYNKEAQPVQDTAVDKVQFDKEESGWNDRMGLNESQVSGKYFDNLGKKRIIGFNLNEVKELSGPTKQSGLYEVNLEGLGNTFTNIERNNGSQLSINESTVRAINKFKFFTNGKEVFAQKNAVQVLSESEHKVEKPVMNEQMNKMKHLLGYKPNNFTNTDNVKKNRGF